MVNIGKTLHFKQFRHAHRTACQLQDQHSEGACL
jgi:hypothetical protein